MKRSFVGLTCLIILLAALLVGGASLGAAQTLVGPRPTPTSIAPAQGSGEVSPRSPDALPDLIVTDIRVSPESPYVDGSATIYVTIMNVGTADVDEGNNFWVDLYINPTTDDLEGLPGIDPYPDDLDKPPPWGVQGVWMKVDVPVELEVSLSGIFTDTASYDLWAQVDRAEYDAVEPLPNGNVIELREDNNILGPETVNVRTRFSWVEEDHVDFFSNMASTLNTVPVESLASVIESTPGLEVSGDSALVLGHFDEPPWTSWGGSGNTPDYNMREPDLRLNEVTDNDQRFPYIHAATVVDADSDLVPDTDLVVAVWEDGQDGPTWGKDIYLRWSDDDGERETWQPAIRVNDDVGYADQKRPSVAVAPNGNVVVAWQDNRLVDPDTTVDFDIYVQVFQYDNDSGMLFPCDKNGHCDPEHPCDLNLENECNIRVDTGASDQDQILPDISVDNESNFYVAWQDRRNYNYDIFSVRSYYTDGDLNWAHDARISDDPGITTQAAPDITAVQGKQVDYITATCEYVGNVPIVQIDGIRYKDVAYVVVAWEDDREGDLDIYMTYSEDGGETFVDDRRLNNDTGSGYDQRTPAVAVNQWEKQISISKECELGTASTSEKMTVTTMHFVWQDFRNSTAAWYNDDPDIYYTTATVQPKGGTEYNILEVSFGDQQKVNDDDVRAWQTGKVWQSDPDVAATSSGLTLEASDSYNAFVAWADWRNYGAGDFANPDIYFRLFSTVGTPTEFVGGNNAMVNNNARLHDYDTDNPAYGDYGQDMPPHAQQRHPSISSTLVANWPSVFGGWVFVAWDDDRLLDPNTNDNVYMARSNMLFGGHGRIFTAVPPDPDVPGQGERYGSGAYISRIFDGGSPDTEWYNVDWHAITDDGTYITLQTRMGNTLTDVLNSDWYPERYPYPDDAISVGAPLQGYDAPGQHIEDAAGNTCPDNCPTARYIQYRVNFWARDANPEEEDVTLYTPFLFDVILGYEPPFGSYLPLVLRTY